MRWVGVLILSVMWAFASANAQVPKEVAHHLPDYVLEQTREGEDKPRPLTAQILTPMSYAKLPRSIEIQGRAVWDPKQVSIDDLTARASLVDPMGVLPPVYLDLTAVGNGRRPFVIWSARVSVALCGRPQVIRFEVSGGGLTDVSEQVVWTGSGRDPGCPKEPGWTPPGPFAVNTDLDERDAKPGDGFCAIASNAKLCSLRAAVEESNAQPGPNEITFIVDDVTLEARLGDVVATDPVLIQGNGRNRTRINTANGPARLSFINPHAPPRNVNHAIADLTIQGGPTGMMVSSSFPYYGSLEIRGVTFRNVSTTAVTAFQASAILRNVQIEGGGASGTAIFGYNSAISLLEGAVVDRTGETIVFAAGGLVAIENATISGNRLRSALFDGGADIDVRHATIVDNTVSSLTPRPSPGPQVVRVSHSIFANPSTIDQETGASVNGECLLFPQQLVSVGATLFDSLDGCAGPSPTDQTGTDAAPLSPGLLASTVVGGTSIHQTAAGSPAYDRGDRSAAGVSGQAPASFVRQPDALYAQCLLGDQTGRRRPQSTACDIGAMER